MDSICDIIIAIVAIAGFVLSIIVSFLTLKRTKSVSLLERRLKLMEFLITTATNRHAFFKDKNNHYKLVEYSYSIEALTNSNIASDYKDLINYSSTVFAKSKTGADCQSDEATFGLKLFCIANKLRKIISAI